MEEKEALSIWHSCLFRWLRLLVFSILATRGVSRLSNLAHPSILPPALTGVNGTTPTGLGMRAEPILTSTRPLLNSATG
jgi:hypothetical protein